MLPRPLSFSSLGVYRDCPRQYKYKNVDNLPFDKPSYHYMDVGTLVHKAIEVYLKTKDVQAVNDELTQLDGFSSANVNKALDIFNTFIVGTIIDDFMPTEFIEYEFVHEIEGIPVKGTIDAVVIYNKKLYLIDWKIRRSFYPEDAIRKDLQLHLYARVFSDLTGLKIHKAVQYQITSAIPKETAFEGVFDFSAVPEPLRTKYVNPVEIDLSDESFLQAFLSQARKIRDDNEYTPTYNAYVCKDCPFLNICT